MNRTVSLGALSLLYRYRGMLRQTAWNEIRTRYAGSVLGLTWLFIYPLLFLGVYSVYMYIMIGQRAGATGRAFLIERVLLTFCGLIPFLGFADALARGVTAVTDNANLIKNTLFPIELVPVKAVLVAQTTQVVGTGMLLVCLAGFGRLTAWALILPLIWLLQIVLSTGIAWILSSLNVYFRDLQNIIGVVTLMLMLISPIAWTPKEMQEALPTILPLTYLNPLQYVIFANQQSLLYGRFPGYALLTVLAVMALAFFFIGFWFFRRMKRVFADNV